MLDDKYIGLALAVSGTVAIGSSFIITKKACPIHSLFPVGRLLTSLTQGLNDAADRGSTYAHASDDRAYFRSPIWWTGMAISQYPGSSTEPHPLT